MSEPSDAEMADAPTTAPDENRARETGEMTKEKQRLRLLPGATDNAASFAFDQEDHTLGNALRYMIMKNPDVEFCGYSIPHPSEAVMNLRIQTYDDVSVFSVLRKGLDDLGDLCDVVEGKFTVARDEYNSTNPEDRNPASNS